MRGIEKAREKMLSETNIVKIVESRRYFKEALKFLLSKENQTLMKQRSRHITVDPDNSSSSDPNEELEIKRIKAKVYPNSEASALQIVDSE